MPLSKYDKLPDTRTSVYIDILPESTLRQSSSSSHLRGIYKSPQGVIVFRPPSNTPRRMRDIDPTVTFVSTSVVIAKSSYIILLDGAPIHNEDTKLECIGPYFTASANPPDGGPLLYSTGLVPKYWEFLCKSPDPTVYTILHDVYCPADPAPCLQRRLARPRPVLIFSATYHFRYLVPVYMPLSSVTPRCAYQANAPLIADTACACHDLPEPTCPQKHSMHTSLSDDESLRSHEDSSQNPLNKQFILDVSMDDSDSMVNIHYSPETASKGMIPQSSASSLPKDIRNYIM
ncbi:hypothetical protein BDR03DRAFT_940955 [Suillus americanus]|nr:hypothetical protein BDR03DRAFT_940955 [Suillus americanus]